MTHYDYDLFVIGGGSGGVRAARVSAVARQARGHRRGIPLRRHLRHPRLRAEEVSGLRLAVFRDVRGRAPAMAGPCRETSLRLGDADRQQGPRDRRGWRRSTSAASRMPAARPSTAAPSWSMPIRCGSSPTAATVTAETILIATGGRPQSASGAAGPRTAITSNDAFHLPELPKAIVIAGGGYIAVEFANIFHGLGVETTLVYRGEEILGRFDHDMRHGPARGDGEEGHHASSATTCSSASKSARTAG